MFIIHIMSNQQIFSLYSVYIETKEKHKFQLKKKRKESENGNESKWISTGGVQRENANSANIGYFLGMRILNTGKFSFPYIIEYCSFMQFVRLVHPTLSMAREFSLEIDQFVASRIRASAEKNWKAYSGRTVFFWIHCEKFFFSIKREILSIDKWLNWILKSYSLKKIINENVAIKDVGN